MKKDEIIAMLQKQNSFLQKQLQEANHKMDALLEEVSSLRNLLEQKGWVDKASFVANCGLPNQKVVKDIRESKGDEGYFVTILVEE